jgi:hypothetical protein
VQFQDGFQWPHFVLTHEILCDLDLATDGDEPASIRMKLYNKSLRNWTKVKLGFVIKMTEGHVVLLKGLNVTDCPDFDQIITSTSTHNRDNNQPHMRKNLRNERAHVRRKLKERAVMSSEEDELAYRSFITPAVTSRPSHPSAPGLSSSSSDEEDEFATTRAEVKRLITPAITINPARYLPSAHQTKAQIMPAVRYDSVLELTDDDAQPESSGSHRDSETSVKMEHADRPGKRRLSSSSPSMLPQLASPLDTMSPPPGHCSEDAIIVDDGPLWPADFYVVDIVGGFKECDRAKLAGVSIAKTFHSLFGLDFRRTTYYDNKKRWETAPQASCAKSLKAGRSPEGLWPAFLAHNRSLRASRSAKTSVKKSRRK